MFRSIGTQFKKMESIMPIFAILFQPYRDEFAWDLGDVDLLFDFIFEKTWKKKVDIDEKFTKFFGEEMNKRDVKQILVRSDAEFRWV